MTTTPGMEAGVGASRGENTPDIPGRGDGKSKERKAKEGKGGNSNTSEK